MSNHARVRKNLNDVQDAWTRWQQLVDKQLPSSGAQLVATAILASGKRNLWAL